MGAAAERGAVGWLVDHDLRRVREALAAEVPDTAWARIERKFSQRELAVGEFLVRAGDAASLVGFVLSGALREFYVTPGGNEFNKAFCMAGDFTGSLADLLSGQPSQASIEALQPSRLVCVAYADLRPLFEDDQDWGRAGRVFAERMFVLKARREYELLTMSAQERYESLLERDPDLEDRVPQYHLASHLGITAVALSRIRARMGRARGSTRREARSRSRD